MNFLGFKVLEKKVRFDEHRRDAKAHIPNDARKDEKRDEDDGDERLAVPGTTELGGLFIKKLGYLLLKREFAVAFEEFKCLHLKP